MSNEPASAVLPAGMSATAFSSLFQAVNGLRNRSALIAMIGCTVLGVLVAGLLFSMGGFFGGLLGFLVWVIAVGTGINAAGTLHMDSARGISPRSVIDALVFGLTCIPKLVVLALALFLVSIAVFIVLAILFLICKIPFLGPLLFAVVFPVSVVVAGVTSFGLFLCMALSLPAIWQGATISRALSQTLAIARSRLVEAVLLLVFVSILGFAVSLIVFAVLGFGFLPTLGMSAAIVGFSGMGDMGGMGMGALGGMAGGMGGGGGHAIAGMIGGFVLWALAISLVSQVNLLGLCLVYLRVTEGLDLTASDEALRRSFDEARRRTAELGEKARNAAQRATDANRGAAGVAAGAAAGVAASGTSTSAPAAAAPFAGDPVSGMAPPEASAVPPAYTPASFAAAPAPTFAPPPFAAPPFAAPPAPMFPPPSAPAYVPEPPPAFAAAPSPVQPPFMPPPLGPETTAPFLPTAMQDLAPTAQSPFDDGADIALPFDEVPAPHAPAAFVAPVAPYAPPVAVPPPPYPPAAAPTAYGVPPAYVPPTVAPAPAQPAAASTTCPQCLSAVTPDDLFCGVCGYRLK